MFVDYYATNTNLDISSEENVIMSDLGKTIKDIRREPSPASDVFNAKEVSPTIFSQHKNPLSTSDKKYQSMKNPPKP